MVSSSVFKLFLLILLTSWEIHGKQVSTKQVKTNEEYRKERLSGYRHHEHQAKQLALASTLVKLVKAVQQDDYRNSSLELSPGSRTPVRQNRGKHQSNSFSTQVPWKATASKKKQIKTENVEVICIAKNCGKCITLSPKRGKIQSPNFPRGYGNNLDCIYTIETTSPGYTIELRFTTFLVERNRDFVSVQQGNRKKKTLTGYTRSEPITTHSRKITVNFNTNKDNKELNAAKTNGGKWEAIYTIKKLPERTNPKTSPRNWTTSTTRKNRFQPTTAKAVFLSDDPTANITLMAKEARAISEENPIPVIIFSDASTINITSRNKVSSNTNTFAGYVSTETASVLKEPSTSTEVLSTTIPTQDNLNDAGSFKPEIASTTKEPKPGAAKIDRPKFSAKTPIIAYPHRHGISNPKKLEWFILENFRAF